MPGPGYSQYTLDALAGQLGVILDDLNEVYWTRQEKYYAIWEGLRVFGAYTAYWKDRGTFNVSPTGGPFYDLSVQMPTLRSRTWTLGQMVQEIQYMLLEAPNGLSGAFMSGQVPVATILQTIQRARNKFVLDARFPLSVHIPPTTVPDAEGLVYFDQNSVYVHRVSWLDQSSQIWGNLWRQDAWSDDKANPIWTVDYQLPYAYSEAELAPLTLQLYPPPANQGTIEVISVDSFLIDITNPNATFNVPDEWVHAIKYAALAQILTSQNQINDGMRAEYCMQRYSTIVDNIKNARSIIRLKCGAFPIETDSLAAIDAGTPYWRSQAGPPNITGVMYDYIAVAPGILDGTYNIAVDVVRAAPLPATGADYIQLGEEDIANLTLYCTHILTFKCGGSEFKNSFQDYDAWLTAMSGRGFINRAKIPYITPLFGQPYKEEVVRPDRLEKQADAGN